jgi:hypothetical protein
MFLRDFVSAVSASQINTFRSCPAYWASTRLQNLYFPAGPAATRGQAIEEALQQALLVQAQPTELLDVAYALFDKAHPRAVGGGLNIGTDPVAAQRAHIAPTVEKALPMLRRYGALAKPPGWRGQWEVVAQHPVVPIKGFTDFVFPDVGVIVDLKTVARLPTQMKPEHMLQMAIYAQACPGYTVDVLYAAPTGARVFRMTQAMVATGWAQAVDAVHRMDRLLQCAPTLEELFSMMVPNTTTIHWQGPEAHAHLAKTFPAFV